MVTHSVTMPEKHLVFTGETPPRNFTMNRVKKRSIKPEDPMSHRIIEKRRRDRMNNCLADLSRLIPPEYLKKGRGRIEKTEIIEMAIKHMRHLQNIIATTRFNGNTDSSLPSPPDMSTASRDGPTIVGDQPIIVEHYRLGYLECLSEAMHFLVEVRGYFSGDSLCVQMINHLHKHCDKILKGNSLNFPRKHTGETTSRDSSTSPTNGNYNNSPPLAMSNSTGSTSDDNQPPQSFEQNGRPFEEGPRTVQTGYHSPKRYSETCYPKRNPDGVFPRFVEPDGKDSERMSENRSDSDIHQPFILKNKNNEIRKEESKSYLNNFEAATSFPLRNYSNVEDTLIYENGSLKEENGSSPSQLREMLTSPLSICAHVNGHSMDGKGNTSPLSNTSGYEASPSHHPVLKTVPVVNYKSQNSGTETNDGNADFSESSPPDNHHMMYKFKNNIKQRFSKEKRENLESDDQPVKKPKPNDDYQRYPDPLMKERLNLLDRTDVDEEKPFKFNSDMEIKKRHRYGSESEIQDIGDISNRLSFGHKSSEKAKKWEDSGPGFQCQSHPKLWHLSPNNSIPFFGGQPPLGAKLSGKAPLPITEYSSAVSNSFNNLSISMSESTPGIPIFALHAKGSFYIPLTLDHATLAPFLTILGIAKTDEGADEKTVLHPVTISVNFQSHSVR